MSDILNSWPDFFKSVHAGPAVCNLDSKIGSITIMGTGLRGADFLADLKPRLENADVVLYCVADPVTESLITECRADAIDLSVLYASGKPRYYTYVQMAEAMLMPARMGRHVLVLFYGHPGVFAMPTHRAVAIAKAEGLSASMRPGISALDYLIADVGFDPAYPGLLTYEATDLLLRQRRLDPTLHVVLWQIGVVGEMSFDRSGFRNDGFEFLVDVLERAYGDAEVVHYIGSRFPGVAPLIDRHSVRDLRKAAVRASISALSTLYIPPSMPATTDAQAAVNLRIDDVDSRAGGAPPAFDITRYGTHEQSAIAALAGFEIPTDYRRFERTPAVEMMCDLMTDPKLQQQFATDPLAVLNMSKYASLPPRARDLLAGGDVKAAHIAMYERGLTK